MLKRMLAACLVLLVVSPLIADTTVLHVAGQTSGWRGAYNNSASYCWLDGWPGTNADAGIAGFDRATLQAAINSQITTSGGWNAKVITTQITWSGNPAIPTDLGPVVGVIDVDSSTFAWGHVSDNAPSAFNAGTGSWRFNSTNYANFVAAYNASSAAGKSFLFTPTTSQWAAVKYASLPDPNAWNVEVDVPEDIIVRYLNNTAAEGIFMSATIAQASKVQIYQGDQWGGVGDLRVLIAAPPTSAPWINASILSVNQTIALSTPTLSVPVTVTNAGTGTLTWTAAESPDVGWLTVANATGTAGQQCQINLDVTGMAVGTYTTNVTITAPGANNSVTIPVNVNVVTTAQPIIQLVPTSLTFTAKPTDSSVPPAQSVTVTNIGLGTLAWTAAESPDVSWITTIIPASGASGGKFNVGVDHRGMAGGTYTATIRVSDPNAQNNPQNVTVTLTIREQDADITKANSYDDAWEAGKDGWAAEMWHLRVNATGKTAGFITLLGDSITYANPHSQWPRYGSGKTAADIAICNWMHAGNWGTGSNNSDNGWYLAAYDVSGRNGSFTARSGITAGQFLTGSTPLPSVDAMFTAGFSNPDGKQYRDALMAVILLGTNDLGGGNTAALTTNLNGIIDKLQAAKVIPILTTLPPRVNADTNVGNFNTAIRSIATTRKLPLIDYWTEITRRRPGNTWQNTLISGDGVHPSSSGGAYTASSDPYASSGAALSDVGYLLRSWLTVQKIAEVKAKALDVQLGDVDRDGHCDVVDLLFFVDSFGWNKGDAMFDQRCDFNGDDAVDVVDLLDLVSVFGTY
jgi:hypothetical protein